VGSVAETIHFGSVQSVDDHGLALDVVRELCFWEASLLGRVDVEEGLVANF